MVYPVVMLLQALLVTTSQSPAFEYDRGSGKVVLWYTLSHTGVQGELPGIELHADGQVRFFNNHQPLGVSGLTPQEVENVVAKLAQVGLFELDTKSFASALVASLQAELRRTAPEVVVTGPPSDASIVILRVRLDRYRRSTGGVVDNFEHTISIKGLDFWRARLPGNQQLRAIAEVVAVLRSIDG